jgi:hypothetical protein
MENQQLSSPSRHFSSTPVGFGQGFLSKEQRDNAGASPILSSGGCSWSLPVPSTEISIEGTVFVRRNSWKGFHRMASSNVSNNFAVAYRTYICIKGLFWRKCSFSYCTVLYFWKITYSGNFLKLPRINGLTAENWTRNVLDYKIGFLGAEMNYIQFPTLACIYRQELSSPKMACIIPQDTHQ